MRLRVLIGATVLAASCGSALAVDRPREAPVHSCPGHGPGFYEVPGTTTCIRIGGRVRSEYQATTRRSRDADASGLRNTGQVSVDTRTDTAYGPVRTYVRVRGGQVDKAFVQTR